MIRLLALLLVGLLFAGCKKSASPPAIPAQAANADAADAFLSLMNAGKNYFDQGDATNAITTYKKALGLVPTDVDVHLNLANSYLMGSKAAEAIFEADEVLKIDSNSAAAYFVKGSAHLRLSSPEEAVKALENSRKIDPGEKATLFQLGIARMGLKQWEEAISAFREGLAMDPNRLHAGVYYLLGQSLSRAGREAEAKQSLDLHQQSAEAGGADASAATFERSKFTQARVPFRLEQPDKEGIKVRFVDATAEAFGSEAQSISGPLAILSANHTGWSSLFAFEKGRGLRAFWNTNGVFAPDDRIFPSATTGAFSKALVGDLQNDRFDDVIVLGEQGGHLFKFATNRLIVDASALSQLTGLRARDGILIDLDFTGKLDLLTVQPGGAPGLFRQFGPLFFKDVTSTSGIPVSLVNARAVKMADWNRDENMDVVISRANQAPLLLEKQRGGKLIAREMTNWVNGEVFVAADFDNDLRTDLAIVSGSNVVLCLNNGEKKEIAALDNSIVRQLAAVDYDNDGWLDLWVVGDKMRAFRNGGLSGFTDQTSALGLSGAGAEMHFADFDQDCDSDALIALPGGGVRYLRNEGGNSNSQVKVNFVGNRSNAAGIGCKVQIETGGLRLIRTVEQGPMEIGVGKHTMLDSFLVHWFNWPQGSPEVIFNCKEPVLALELTIQEGSCPYLYAWNGDGFVFVTDILGAAPLGLPMAEKRYIESDPEEFIWIGNEKTFLPRDGFFEVKITEELREVLYLDEAKLVVVDREPREEIHPTDKLLPGKPFPKGSLIALRNQRTLRRAEIDGRDVTGMLNAVDGQRVSPPRLRSPQLRGLAEPHQIILDFGQLDASKPLALVMNGWLRFGGGMANIGASHDPDIPFPFPTLEAEVNGAWQSVDAVVGAPAGKTKTIVADLDGKLPRGATRLRLTQSFEIHWDRIALMEKAGAPELAMIPPMEADLRFRGFSALKDLPSDWPLTPDYSRVSTNWHWTIIPGGWCTRYGDVSELIARRDEGLALINSGDELSLKFAVNSLPPKTPGKIREFFLYVDGWDKDSDFHVAAGTKVEPLPFHGMDDQRYGSEARPSFESDLLHSRYNTRWVEGRVLKQSAQRLR